MGGCWLSTFSSVTLLQDVLLTVISCCRKHDVSLPFLITGLGTDSASTDGSVASVVCVVYEQQSMTVKTFKYQNYTLSVIVNVVGKFN